MSLCKTGHVTVLMIQMFCGLTGKGNFWTSVNIHAPLWTRRARTKKAAWINSEFKKGMSDSDDAKRKAMALNDPRDWAKYKKMRKTILKKTSKLLEHLIILTLLFNLKVILEKHGKQLTSLLPVPPTIQGWKNCNCSRELSNAFNDYFATIGPRLANEIPPTDNNDISYINNINVKKIKFSFSSTSSNIVFSHLNKLSRSKATGLDNISAKIKLECADVISVSLCDLFINI